MTKPDASKTFSMPKDTLHFEMLGIRVQVQFACQRTQLRVADHLSAHLHPPQEQSPNILVRLTEPLEDDRFRYLFRAQPEGVVQGMGAFIFYHGLADWEPWNHADPVLIPYAMPALRDRFVALHAASVVSPRSGRATLLMGQKCAGKTTTALDLNKKYDWPMLTDETAVIDAWSKQCWALMRPPHVTNAYPANRVTKAYIGHDEMADINVATDPAPIARIVELIQAPGLNAPYVEKIDTTDAKVATTFAHTLAFGSAAGTVARTVMALSQKAEVMRVMHGGFPQLTEVAKFLEAHDAG